MLQGLNRTKFLGKSDPMDTETCKHQPVYFGVVNINIDERTIGSVDVWRCGRCKKKFCEEKQLGIESISEIVGMPKIESNEKWGVTICKLQKGMHKWKLVRLKDSFEIKHECLEEKIIPLQVKNYQVDDDQHWSFLVENHINKAVEI